MRCFRSCHFRKLLMFPSCDECSKMLGATMPSESACGTIRGDFCIEVGR